MHGKKKKRMQGIRASFKIENLKKDCHPKGDHGPPKGDNQAQSACMLVVVFTA